ncbi:uncharacterized protein HMPREF1541_00662 [Cyphellophora europaea CBS 101466]|uniref:DUF3074 domain-containing protein n=1 Tax=Cyphellophora europaea (strain CBS 101466) TaxID=1220924 RepID=W2SCQ8_CYPE1|nr:uncharacterized protein HMPREF1541_00662 [Cyphellophora europaea CBS 101466]ETN46477.1 hypothetical protein HMPREF1541_00662 [Cyphellophora europaea CBS 101466]
MAELHKALQALAPADFAEVPSNPEDLDAYLSDIFEQTQLILDSIPIASPDEASLQRAKPGTSPSAASSASEMLTSGARSEPPAADRLALQKEWGKPIKLGQKENTLGMSVYKASGKDSRGAWFARRSVHEGLGFNRFKKAFEAEFPTSLAVQGNPGEGNIRGIGAETRVEDITAPSQGKVEVYRLSAQFPGPTTPRDFVTLLLTSPKALKPQKEGQLVPRHYMIVSKPCNHPETQPRDGFIRGQYESVEFIREIPRRLKTSTSSTDLSHIAHRHGHNLEQDVLIHNAEKYGHLNPGDEDKASRGNSRDPSPAARKRSHTVADPVPSSSQRASGDGYDPEDNPVEWIMVTRSDPGGSVPRFMVERGTPSSICADAVKFLDWACKLDESAVDSPDTPTKPPTAFRRESFTSFASREKFPDVDEDNDSKGQLSAQGIPQATLTDATPTTPNMPQQQSGVFASVAGAFSTYAPQSVLNHFPASTEQQPSSDPTTQATFKQPLGVDVDDNDAASTISSTSFASADSHLSRELSPDSPTASFVSQTSGNKPQTAHEKELAKLAQRRSTLEAKHAATKAKLQSQTTTTSAKEAAALKKAEEKHEKELRKHEERYKRELEKLEQRKVKEDKKAEARKKRQGEKDEKDKLRNERDELKEKLEVLEREAELWRAQVGDLQKQNTNLMARIGRLEAGSGGGGDARSEGSGRSHTEPIEGEQSRSSTPTPAGLAPRAAMGETEKRSHSDENLKRFSSRVRTMTLNSLGMGDKADAGEAAGGSGGGSQNRSRSSSLFRKKNHLATEGAPPEKGMAMAASGSEKASLRSEGSEKSRAS